MSDKPELKPCPFCGKPYAHTSGTQGYWMVECSSCGGIGPCFADFKDSEGKAIEAWNQRADLAKPSEWISVSEDTPDDSRNIVAIGEGYIEIGFRSGVDTDPELWADFHFKVSHWCELPANKPPTRETL